VSRRSERTVDVAAESEIVLRSLRSYPGANFWSRRPVTRLDLSVGAFDEISSADVPGFTERLVAALPGLVEHRCSVGERGGFVLRLQRGTYAPHIIEHVSLQLQSEIGHDVAYGRARGGDREGEYTVVFRHLHAAVGLRAATLALETVRDAFAGRSLAVGTGVEELRSLAEGPDPPPLFRPVRYVVTGGSGRQVTLEELLRRTGCPPDQVVDVAPSTLLEAGMPVDRADVAIILDATLDDVPLRYAEPDRARQLVSVVADAIDSSGWIVLPASDEPLRDRLVGQGAGIGFFLERGTAPSHIGPAPLAMVRSGRIVIADGSGTLDAGAVESGRAVAPQLAGALASFLLTEAANAPS
jgi:hypothetical protein